MHKHGLKQIIEAPDYPVYDTNFLSGICCLSESDYKQARHFFLTAITESEPLEAHHDVYHSYLRLSDVLIDHANGSLNHCSPSSNASLPVVPEIQLNQACAEFLKGNRKHGVQAINKLDNLKLSLENSDEIHSFFDIVGKRNKNNNGLLKRNNFIHKFIGKIFRKKENPDTMEHIEVFIRETAKNRYQCTTFNI